MIAHLKRKVIFFAKKSKRMSKFKKVLIRRHKRFLKRKHLPIYVIKKHAKKHVKEITKSQAPTVSEGKTVTQPKSDGKIKIVKKKKCFI